MVTAQTHLEAALAILLRERDSLDDQLRSIRSVIGAPKATAASPQATPSDKPARKKRRKLSAEARERIAAAQKKRWEKFRSAKKAGASKG